MADKVKAGDVVQVRLDDDGPQCGKLFVVKEVSDEGVTGARVATGGVQEHTFLAWEVIGAVATPRVPAARTSPSSVSHASRSAASHKPASRTASHPHEQT